MKIRTVGIVLETEADALEMNRNMEHLYHWRVPHEIEAVVESIKALGYQVKVIGTPEQYLLDYETIKETIDFIFNMSVGFISRFRLAQGPMLYETGNIPYSGADPPYTKMTTQNKHIFKSFMDKMGGIGTPSWHYVHHPNQLDLSQLPPRPLFVKPAYEGSSIGINEDSKILDENKLVDHIKALYDDLGMP